MSRHISRRSTGCGARLADLIGVPGDQIVIAARGFGHRLALPDDPEFVRLWGIELDLEALRLRIGGVELDAPLALYGIVTRLIARSGMPTEIHASEFEGLEQLLADYPWLLERTQEGSSS